MKLILAEQAKMELNQVQRVRFLYKTILRIHRGLPDDIRILGNSYVRDEFKRHKSCNQQEAQVFMTGWMVRNEECYLLRL